MYAQNYTDSVESCHAQSAKGKPGYARANSDKKINSKRLKSPYRDAKFRPLFQALAELGRTLESGGTSVKYETPNHPTYPKLNLQAASHHKRSTSPLIREELTDEEDERTKRFWRQYAVELPGLTQHRLPAPWSNLSDQAAAEWYHYGLKSAGALCSFTLNLSEEVEKKTRSEAKSADWLAKRISRRLRAALGRKVDFWFAFETSDKRRLHIHGEIQISGEEKARARKALRLAGGEWNEVRQHQCKTDDQPSVVWANYCMKRCIFMRPKKGRLATLERPISGDWLFATNGTRRAADSLYTAKRAEVIQLIQEL